MKKNSAIKPWLYAENCSEKFCMLPPELFEEPAFMSLSCAAKLFYILINTHYATNSQRSCLYETLTEYNELCGLGLTEFDIRNEAFCTKKSKFIKGYFVIPEKHLKSYGYSSQYANKCKKELLNAGFIEVEYGAKDLHKAWTAVTIYKFSNRWKLNHS